MSRTVDAIEVDGYPIAARAVHKTEARVRLKLGPDARFS